MEYLETKGVPVIGYQTDELPAFFTRESGVALTSRADTPEEIARIFKAKQDLHLEGGMVIANPVPEKMNYLKTTSMQSLMMLSKKQKFKESTGKILHHSYSKQLLKNCRKKFTNKY